MSMTTETLDRLYLEWSQFTRARTAREIELLAALKMLREIDDAYGFDLNEPQRDQMHDAIRKAEGPLIADHCEGK